MFLKKTKRILAFTLLLAMLLSILPPVAFAADNETRWKPIELNSIKATDTIAITMSKDGKTFVLPTVAEGSKKQPLAVAATIAGDQLVTTGEVAMYSWTLTATGSGHTITSNNQYLYLTSDNNGVRIGNTESIWTINGGYLTAADTSQATRYLGVYNSTDWRCYTTINNNIKNQTLGFWALDNETDEPSCDHDWGEGVSSATCTEDGEIIYTCTLCGETKKETIKALGHNYVDGVCERCGEAEAVAPEGQYVKLVSGDTLSVGDTVVIVCESKAMEMKDFSKTTYALGEPYTDIPNAVYPLTVFAGATEGTLSLKGEGGYLSWSSGNTLILAGDVTVNSSWIITINDSDNAIIANSKDNARKIQWNAGNPRFAAYTSSQTAVQLYRFETGEVEEPTVPTEPSCEHNNATSVETTPATCTEKGTLTYTCPCGESWTEDITALGHEYNEGEITVAPDCVTDGTWTKTCIRCPQTLEEPIPAMGHSYVDGVCSNCGEAAPEVVSYKLITLDNVKEGNYIIGAVRKGAYPTIYPATAEISTGTYNDWIVSDTAVTAFEDVITSDQLPEDGQIIIFTGNNTDGFSIGFESDGVMKYLGYTTTDKNRTLGFSENYADILWTVVADSEGGFALSTPIDGGNYVISQNSTSTTAIRGYASGTLYTGLYLFAQVVQLDPENCPHASKTTIEKQDPTCVSFGYIKWECADCGTTGEDILNMEPENHTPVAREDILQEASCMQEGLKEIITICSICNAELSRAQEVIPLAPHTYEEGFCTVCIKDAPGKTFYLVSDPLDLEAFVLYHPASGTALSLNPSDNKLMASEVTVENGVLTTVEDTAVFRRIQPLDNEFPLRIADYIGAILTSGETKGNLLYTTEESAYGSWKPVVVSAEDRTFRFENQGSGLALQFYKDQFSVYAGDGEAYIFQIYNSIPVCDHQWDDGVQVKDPKCNETGQMLYTCTLCGDITVEILPTVDHAWQETATVDPTCTEDGYTSYICPDCGETMEDPIPSNGHDYVAGTPVEPTCTEDGYTLYTCTLCGDISKEDILPTLGHEWEYATCTQTGYCKACGISGGAYRLVTSPDDLSDDDRIIIVAPGAEGGLTLDTILQDNGKILPVPTEIYRDHLNGYDDLLVWTLVETEEGFALHAADGYLGSAGAKSANFKFVEDSYTWIFSQTDEGFRIKTSDANRYIAYSTDGKTPVFGAYAESNLSGKNYTGDLLIFKYVEGATLPHVDNSDPTDNLCDDCDDFIKPAALVSRSISLNGNIAVNFYMSLCDEITSDDSAYMLFKQEDKKNENGEDVEVKVYIKDCVKKQVRGKDAYCFTYEVAAKEMTDTITAQFFYGDTCTEEYTYSVKTYADNQRTNLSDNQPLMNLLDAMLRYGAAAQIHFAHRTDRLADAGMETVSYGGVVIDKYPINLPQGTDLVQFAGASLILRSETAIRLIFKADPSVAETLTVTYNGEPLKVIPISGMYTVIIDNIAAAALDQDFTVTVNDGIEEATVTYCPLSYCQSIRSKATSSADLMDVCAALYLYNLAANSYFEPAE